MLYQILQNIHNTFAACDLVVGFFLVFVGTIALIGYAKYLCMK